jgi:hypothetical protein
VPWRPERYPAAWKAISARIREWAGNQCEWQYGDGKRCAAPHHAYIHRCTDDPEVWQACRMPWATDSALCWCRERDAELGRRVRVVLTTAHTCDCDPICGDEAHLLSLCQWHHNALDRPMRIAHARQRRRAALLANGQQELALPG